MIFSSDRQRKAVFAKNFLGNSNKFSSGDRMRPTKELIAEQKALLFKINNMPYEHTKEDVSSLVQRLDQLDHVLNQKKDRMSISSPSIGDKFADAVTSLWPNPREESVTQLVDEFEPVKESVGDSFSDLIVGFWPEPRIQETREIMVSPSGEVVEVIVDKPKRALGDSLTNAITRLWP